MPALSLPIVWNWLRAREWTTTGLLPPPPEKLRWPNWIRLYLLLSAGITLATFLFFFVSFFGMWFTGLSLSPPPLSFGSVLNAVVRCWRSLDWMPIYEVWSALLPLQIISHFWNKRAVCLARKQATLAASIDTIWPPPPQRPT